MDFDLNIILEVWDSDVNSRIVDYRKLSSVSANPGDQNVNLNVSPTNLE